MIRRADKWLARLEARAALLAVALRPSVALAGSAPTAEATSGDVVETIQAAPAPSGPARSQDVVESVSPSAPEPTPPPSVAPATTDKFTLSGWALEETHLALGEAGQGPPYLSVPLDRAVSRTRAAARFRYAHAHWFEVDASSVISYSYYARGLGGSVADDLNDYATRASFEPSLRELYFAFFTSAVDVRIGQQRVAWGRADTQSPNDVLNARDLRDPFQPEPELSQIPTPLARVDWALGSATLEGIWAPFFVPDQFDIYGSNWATVQPDAPAGVRGFFHTMSTLVDPSMVDPFNRLIQQTRLPAPTASNMSAGAKLALTVGDVDMDAYYHYGFDRTPVIRIDPAFQDTLNRTDFSRATPADFGTFFTAIQAGYPPMTIEYERRHHVGFDAGTVLGPIGVKIDAGYDTPRVFVRRDLTGATSPAAQGTLSLEYQTGDARKVFLVEGSVLRLLDDPGPLLFVDRTTFTATALVRVPFLGAFDAELRGIASMLPRSVILRPQLGWRTTDHLTIEAGGLWIAGDPWSLGDYFRRNVETYLEAKYAF